MTSLTYGKRSRRRRRTTPPPSSDRAVAQAAPLAALPADLAEDLFLVRVPLDDAGRAVAPATLSRLLTVRAGGLAAGGQMAAPPATIAPRSCAPSGQAESPLAAAVPTAEMRDERRRRDQTLRAPPAFGGCAVAPREASITDAVPALRGGARRRARSSSSRAISLRGTAVRCLADIVVAADGLDLLGARYVYVPHAGLDAPISLDSALPPGAPALALLVGGAADVSDRLQALAGAVDPKLAKRTDPGSWRADLGEDRLQNAVAVCRSAAGASRAAAFFFGGRLASAAAAPHALLRCAVHAPIGAAFVVAPPAALEPLLAELGAAAFTLHAAARAPAQSLEALVGAGALAAAGAESCCFSSPARPSTCT